MKKILLLLYLSSLGFVKAQIAPPGSVAYYPFTNSSFQNEVSPGTGDLVPVGNGHLFRSDRFDAPNNALRNRQETFNGITLNASTASPINDMSYSFWYLLENNNVGSNGEAIMQNFDASGNGVRIVKITANQFNVRVKINGVDQSVFFQNATIGLTAWTHVAIIVKKNGSNYTVSMYVNGQNVPSVNSSVITTTSDLITSNSTFILSPVISSFGLRSATDDIRIYQRSLTASEAMDLFTEKIDRVYVDVSNTTPGNGETWQSAMTDIPTAIERLNTNGEAWFKSGTYIPTDDGNRNTAIIIDKEILLYGGFNGSETQISARDIAANPTIISGDLLGNDNILVIDGNPTYNDNSVTLIDVNNDNFTLESIYASDASGAFTGFGALFIRNTVSTATVRNCTFQYNVARGGGAGIFYEPFQTGSSRLSVENTVFAVNASRQGSGMYVNVRSATDLTVDIKNCLFYKNAAIDMASGTAIGASSVRATVNDDTGNIAVNILNSAFISNAEQNTTTSTIQIGTDSSVVNHDFNSYNSIYDNNTGTPIEKVLTGPINVTMSHNVTTASTVALGGTQSNVITTSPVYVDAFMDDYRPVVNSNVVNAGDNSFLSGLATDLDENMRTIGAAVDIGPYEFGATAGIEAVVDDNVAQIYPNPTTGLLWIEMEGSYALVKAELYNQLGAILKTVTTTSLSMADLPKGMYYLKIESTSGNSKIKKVIKR